MQVAANVNESLLPAIGVRFPEGVPSSLLSSFAGYKFIHCNGVVFAQEPARILVETSAPLRALDLSRRRACTE